MDLSQYLTNAEKTMLRQRARVHSLLQKGYGVREISRLERISTTTVINVKKYLGLKKPGPKTGHSANLGGKTKRMPWKLG